MESFNLECAALLNESFSVGGDVEEELQHLITRLEKILDGRREDVEEEVLEDSAETDDSAAS